LTAAAVLATVALGLFIYERQRFRSSLRELIPQKSIAVLPFENLSADPENAFFTDGMQDEILNDLAKIADLKVISRTSMMQYKSGAKRNVRQIANELGVAHVVEGSVQRVAKPRPRQRAVNRRKNGQAFVGRTLRSTRRSSHRRRNL